jgi:hypothetical protein
VTRASKHLATLALRRGAKSGVLTVVSERLMVRSKLRLIRGADILTKSRGPLIVGDSGLTAETILVPTNYASTITIAGAAVLFPAANAPEYTTPAFP